MPAKANGTSINAMSLNESEFFNPFNFTCRGKGTNRLRKAWLWSIIKKIPAHFRSSPPRWQTMTTEHDERRRSPRVPCHDVWLQIKVGDQGGTTPSQQLPPRQVRVANISDSGICLVSQEPFDLGQVVYFSDPALPARGTVVWTCRSKIECKAGLQFCPQ